MREGRGEMNERSKQSFYSKSGSYWLLLGICWVETRRNAISHHLLRALSPPKLSAAAQTKCSKRLACRETSYV